jgi:pimeloyl-ACP methyl ester carboxylesterase
MKGWLFVLAAFAAGAASAQALTACRVPGLRNSAQCGVVRRALDPARPDGPKIDVHYVVVPAMARRKLPDPVFLLAGGPGQTAIGVGPPAFTLFSRLNNRRDIVFVDQRGTGQSAPLECADAKRETLAEQSDTDRQFKQLMQCKAALLKLPYIQREADLGFFTTTIAMQDLDAVRAQLGAEQINLVGISYGTRAALEYMRQFPSRARRSVLDSVAPPDMALPASFSTDGQAALDAMLHTCEQQPACTQAYPKLRADWATLLASLPRAETAAHPLTGKTEHFTLTRDMVLGAVPADFYKISAISTPTLLFSGGADPATPPRHGARVAAALGPAAQHVVVPNAGHGVLGVGCARDLLYRFIDAADDRAAGAVDASCVKAIPRPGVFIPMGLAEASK